MIIYLVWDTSGSMGEWGKHLIARGIAQVLEQHLRLGYGCAEMRVVAWGREAHFCDWRSDQEFPRELLITQGSVNAEALISLLGKEPNGKVLLITDGFWSRGDVKGIKRWKECLQPDTLRIIKIGIDADPQLKGNDVFASEDLFAALDGWLNGSTA